MENKESRHTDKYRLDAEWLRKQWARPDGEERAMAFYESIRNAIITDGDYWGDIGRDVFLALINDDPAELLVALCGWGPKNLAKHAWMLRRDADDVDYKIPGTLIVVWNDEQRTSCPCKIRSINHEVSGLNCDVFTRKDAPTVVIQNVFVRFAPFDKDSEYDFQCVSQAERDAADDNEIFWYPPEEPK